VIDGTTQNKLSEKGVVISKCIPIKLGAVLSVDDGIVVIFPFVQIIRRIEKIFLVRNRLVEILKIIVVVIVI
jgi:hypothetical protein